ncbi:MAG: GlsB/YeaQ/YmgE family stress response membrane protein [Saprospiraceae bacterium]
MDGSALIWFLIVGAIAGWLAGVIVRGFGFGLVGNIIIGIVGGLLGGWLLGPVLGTGSPETGSGTLNYILTALIGAVVLLFIASLFNRRRVVP